MIIIVILHVYIHKCCKSPRWHRILYVKLKCNLIEQACELCMIAAKKENKGSHEEERKKEEDKNCKNVKILKKITIAVK